NERCLEGDPSSFLRLQNCLYFFLAPLTELSLCRLRAVAPPPHRHPGQAAKRREPGSNFPGQKSWIPDRPPWLPLADKLPKEAAVRDDGVRLRRGAGLWPKRPPDRPRRASADARRSRHGRPVS